MFNPLMEYSKSEGYLVYEDVDTLMKRNILQLLQSLNPQAEIVFLINTFNITEISWFLDYTWEEFKLLTNSITLDANNGDFYYFISYSFNRIKGIFVLDAKLITFNPFKEGKFDIFNLTVKNMKNELKRIQKSHFQKIWNLNRFPLKVCGFFFYFLHYLSFHFVLFLDIFI